jgi:cytochrome c oxidase subunit II
MAANGNLADNRFKWHDRRIAGIGGLFSLLLLSACTGPYSALDPAGPSAAAAALLWWSMFGFSAVVLVAVVTFYLLALRDRPDEEAGYRKRLREMQGDNQPELPDESLREPMRDDASTRQMQNLWIIGGGIVLPFTSICLLLAFGIPIGRQMLPLPPDRGEAFRVDVTAHQWWWEVSYPGSQVLLVNELHIPAGVPVDVHLQTSDVIHAFWVPRLGGKIDTIPGRVNILRLHADAPGEFLGQCAEFCGLNHAHMQFSVQAHAPEDFARWQENNR